MFIRNRNEKLFCDVIKGELLYVIIILGRCLMKESVCNEVAGIQASTLLKVNFSTFTCQNFDNCLVATISRNAF